MKNFALFHKTARQFYNGKNTECDFSLTKDINKITLYSESEAYNKLSSSKWFSNNFQVIQIY